METRNNNNNIYLKSIINVYKDTNSVDLNTKWTHVVVKNAIRRDVFQLSMKKTLYRFPVPIIYIFW